MIGQCEYIMSGFCEYIMTCHCEYIVLGPGIWFLVCLPVIPGMCTTSPDMYFLSLACHCEYIMFGHCECSLSMATCGPWNVCTCD